ncbi:MAG: ABC transporter ATP-binding protein, partial [Theionarchaea archaeon]|nr:ABC transporter ATP-binding protein [Theionarchaea archaeon]
EGEVFGLLGPNGAGKTTTIRMICTLIPPTSGKVTVLGNDVSTDPIPVKKSIGLLPETPSVYESLTAQQNLEFFCEMYQVPGEKRTKIIDELLSTFGLEDRRNSKVQTFSKGMRQKLALARTLVHDPPIIFLDEPTSGLDPESAKMVRARIAYMSSEGGKTIFLCTHNLVEAESLCSRVAIIKSGKIVMIGSPGELDSEKEVSYLVRMEKTDPDIAEYIGGLDYVIDTEKVDGSLRVVLKSTSSAPDLVEEIIGRGGRILDYRRETRTLEDIYLEAVQ